jgi:hypothetical protein
MAAYGILKDLSKGRPYYEDGIKPVLTKGGQKWFHDTANFLKHADRDPDAVLHPNNLPDNESRIGFCQWRRFTTGWSFAIRTSS